MIRAGFENKRENTHGHGRQSSEMNGLWYPGPLEVPRSLLFASHCIELTVKSAGRKNSGTLKLWWDRLYIASSVKRSSAVAINVVT
jgi:hypothetical protein